MGLPFLLHLTGTLRRCRAWSRSLSQGRSKPGSQAARDLATWFHSLAEVEDAGPADPSEVETVSEDEALSGIFVKAADEKALSFPLFPIPLGAKTCMDQRTCPVRPSIHEHG